MTIRLQLLNNTRWYVCDRLQLLDVGMCAQGASEIGYNYWMLVCVLREPALAKHLEAMNVLTVGDLCSLTEQEVHHLPIAQPKVLNVRRAMEKFAAENHLNTGCIT